MREVVDRGQRQLAASFAEGSWVGARLQAFLGGILLSLGDFDSARGSIEKAIPTLTDRDGADHPRVLEAMAHRATILTTSGDAVAAAAAFRQVVDTATDRPETAFARYLGHAGLGNVARTAGKLPEAESHFRASLQALEEIPGSYDAQATVWLAIASTLSMRQQSQEALAACNTALEVAGVRVSKLLLSQLETARANAFRGMGQLDDMLASTRRALELAEQVYDADHPHLVQLLVNLGGALGQTGSVADAEAPLNRALAIADNSKGVSSQARFQLLQNLGMVRGQNGNVLGALECWEQALEIVTEVAGADSPPAAGLYVNMAWGYAQLGNRSKANELKQRANRIRAGGGK